MGMQDFFVLTEAHRTTAMSLDVDGVIEIDPRPINDGTYVVPKRIVDDPSYVQHCPGLIAFLLTLPWAPLETETVAPPVEEPKRSWMSRLMSWFRG